MKTKTILTAALAFTTAIARAADLLPSWNDGTAKQSIIEFAAKVTKEGSTDFMPPADRSATVDNDSLRVDSKVLANVIAALQFEDCAL